MNVSNHSSYTMAAKFKVYSYEEMFIFLFSKVMISIIENINKISRQGTMF